MRRTNQLAALVALVGGLLLSPPPLPATFLPPPELLEELWGRCCYAEKVRCCFWTGGCQVDANGCRHVP
jgi:hypothetical protein